MDLKFNVEIVSNINLTCFFLIGFGSFRNVNLNEAKIELTL